jgi:transcriptional regulator with XRE-family HTH domain
MNLKTYLKNKSREELAQRTGTTLNYINRLCCHRRRPSPELALKIQEATGGAVTVMELLFPKQTTSPDSKPESPEVAA